MNPAVSNISFGREICGDLDAALHREWLVTNGLGGYASGTVAGVNTRRYHGLLVASLSPPVERTVLVTGLVERATYLGRTYELSTHEFADGALGGNGYRYVESFRLDGTMPVWTYAIADALIERRVFMAHGANTSYVTYRVVRASAPVSLELTPLTTRRDFHALSRPSEPQITEAPGEVAVLYGDGAPLRIKAEGAEFEAGGGWWWNFRYREEAARGLDDRSDAYAPGTFHGEAGAGETVSLIFTVETATPATTAAALDESRARTRYLLRIAEATTSDPVVQQLVLAADQFIVDRRPAGRTLIAGYHWFNDWGRDTMIALPGLTLATRRFDDAASILRAFAGHVRDGLLPNNFPDREGAEPGYNTADASLWYFIAVRAYALATGDSVLTTELLPVLREIAEHHIAGTRYGIGVDPADGLLRAGEPGVQLTWMDAKVGDWVITPRIGKPVEINALWYNALGFLAESLAARGDADAARFAALAHQCRESFIDRFTRDDGRGLKDVVDGPDGDDPSVRPNQIFAVSLPYPLVDGDLARSIVDTVAQELLTSFGLRSLSPSDTAYRGDYGGDQLSRDSAYHQGPVWSWLIGAFVEAYVRVYGDRDAALAFLKPFADHLRDAGLGSISEIFEGDAPHWPRGCVAQAWGVAEVLRVWRTLDTKREG